MIGKFVGALLGWLLVAQVALAQTCLPPVPPFVPADPEDIRVYADLLRRDMEAYFGDAERYFRCQDIQRSEVFDEVKQASEAYSWVLDIRSEIAK
ncbi:MAG: hypothetical protein OSA82_13430 [Paracoccaceae bacterium]|nr:hypothetical protein [Paracoccaceae bacterium]